jgi:hypothetical protein
MTGTRPAMTMKKPAMTERNGLVLFVMRGRVPRIHVKDGMAGSPELRPGMTVRP